MTDGWRFRILTVVDNCPRECLALAADTSISGHRAARQLDRLVQIHGRPETIVSDSGSARWKARKKISSGSRVMKTGSQPSIRTDPSKRGRTRS